MGILKALYIGIFLLFPLGNLVRLSSTSQAYLYPVDIAIFLFVSYGTYLVLTTRKKIRWLYPFHLLIGVALVSLLVNSYWLAPRELFVSSLYILRFGLYLLMIPIIFHLFKKSDSKFLIVPVILSLSCTVLGGLVQYVIYPDLRNLQYLGWDEHLYRVFSSFLDPNFASVIFVILIWVIVTAMHAKKNTNWQNVVYGVAIVTTLVALLLTYSRTGYLAFIGSLLVYGAVSKKIKLLLGVLCIACLGIIFLPKNLASEGVNLLRTASIESRIESYSTAINLWKQSPIVGVGFNSYRYAQDYFLSVSSVESSHAGAGTANSYLFILATTGFVGLAAFIYMIVTVVKLLHTIPYTYKYIRYGGYAVFSTILIGSVTENVFFYSSVMIVASVLFGVVRLYTMEKNER